MIDVLDTVCHLVAYCAHEWGVQTRHFSRWARKVRLSDRALCQAVEEMIRGLIDADLGGSIVKKRIGLAG